MDDKNSSSDDNDGTVKKRKPKRYKDLVREEILEKMEANDSGESDDDNDVDNLRAQQHKDKMSKLEYDDEQKALRAEFMDGDEESDGEVDDWLVKKKNYNAADGDVERERQEELEALSYTAESSGLNLSDPKGEIENGDKFLLDFITNKRWIDQEDADTDDEDPVRPLDLNDNGNESDASLKDLERMDDFESKYNFRFEEANENSGAAISVVGYSRSTLSDTIRRKDDSRKVKRQQRKERKAAERKAKEERLKRLKNARKEELEERIGQIKAVLGEKSMKESENAADEDIDEEMVAKLMEGDFDPDEFEEMMSKMYNDDFYQKEETEWKTDADVKESLRKAAVEEGEDIITNDEGDGGLYDDAGDEMEDDGEYDENEDYEMEGVPNEDEVKEESKLDKKLKKRMLDELYKLDYEDIIGDMPTRFKYRKVQENRYGLRPEEILFSRDSSLKQFVSLKRMAPYIENDEYVPGSKKRRRFREMSSAEIYEEMQKYAPENMKENTKEDEKDAVQPKKKRRRQKKKGKKQESIITSEVANRSEGGETAAASNARVNTPTKAKGSRKKKGKKLKRTEVDEIKPIQQGETDVNPTEDPPSRAELKFTKKKAKKKDGKSQKMSKKRKVDGVSSSRLASYGL